jgi:hypothetical protein
MGKSLENVHTKYDRIFIQCSLSTSSPISARGVSFSQGELEGEGGSAPPPRLFRGLLIVGVNLGERGPLPPSSGTYIPYGTASGVSAQTPSSGAFQKDRAEKEAVRIGFPEQGKSQSSRKTSNLTLKYSIWFSCNS